MSDSPLQFSPHGSSRFELRGRILLLYSEGPFNAEHVRSTATAFRDTAQRLGAGVPWVTVNIVTRSMMCTPDALDAMRNSARLTRPLGRIAAGYVVTADVEGRGLMRPLLEQACADVMAVAFFIELEPALGWAQQQLDTGPAQA